MNAKIGFVPIAFGPPERRMFGIFHSPQASPRRSAILLCNAFGQEAIRAHRFQRVLAERLARAGHAVLRFDYFGTGDSMGSDIDGDLEGWSRDVLTAHRELLTHSQASTATWVGMRLGATVALRAAQSAPEDVIKLILWDPVLDGSSYLTYLRERHVSSLEAVFPIPLTPPPRKVANQADAYLGEALGFALSPVLRAQLSDLRMEEHRWPPHPANIVVITDPDAPEGQEFAEINRRNPGRTQVLVIRHGTNWTTDIAANTALVPTAALTSIVQQAGSNS